MNGSGMCAYKALGVQVTPPNAVSIGLNTHTHAYFHTIQIIHFFQHLYILYTLIIKWWMLVGAPPPQRNMVDILSLYFYFGRLIIQYSLNILKKSLSCSPSWSNWCRVDLDQVAKDTRRASLKIGRTCHCWHQEKGKESSLWSVQWHNIVIWNSFVSPPPEVVECSCCTATAVESEQLCYSWKVYQIGCCDWYFMINYYCTIVTLYSGTLD